MARKIFVSYRHTQGTWVRDMLVPTLETCGCTVLVDRDWFRAGEDLNPEVERWQRQADAHVLVWTDDYFESRYCRDETHQALASRRAVPLLLDDAHIPPRASNALRVDMRTAVREGYEPWRQLLEACKAPTWLRAVQLATAYVERGQSVNVVASGQHLWQPLLRRVKTTIDRDWGEFDLETPWAILRQGFVKKMLESCRVKTGDVAAPPADLLTLHHQLLKRANPFTLALTHFDAVDWLQGHDRDFFVALRHLIVNERKLVLIAQSHKEFASILPAEHPFSRIDVKTVDLR